MNEIQEMMEVELEFSRSIRFSPSDVRSDISVIIDRWKSNLVDIVEAEPMSIEIGDIRVAGGMGETTSDGEKINPALVAVYEEISRPDFKERMFRCALVYQGGGSALAAPGDLVLQFGEIDLIIEAWNTFPIEESSLSKGKSGVSLMPSAVAAIKQYSAFQPQSGTSSYPRADGLPESCWRHPEIVGVDLRIDFRMMEVEVSFALCKKAIFNPTPTPIKRPDYLKIISSKPWVPSLNHRPLPKLRLVE